MLEGVLIVVLGGLALAAADYCLLIVPRRRRRRREIVNAVREAAEVIVRAIRDGDYQEAWAQDSLEPLRGRRAEYDKLISHIRERFSRGEDYVAMWTAIELFSGWEEPLHYLQNQDAPRWAPTSNEPRLIDWNNPQFVLPRSSELLTWAKSWRGGNAKGPRYGTLYEPGDMSRHKICPPNTDVVPGALFGIDWDLDSTPRRLSRREHKRLSQYYGWSLEEVDRQLQNRLRRQYPNIT